MPHPPGSREQRLPSLICLVLVRVSLRELTMQPKAPSSSLRHGPVCSTHGSKDALRNVPEGPCRGNPGSKGRTHGLGATLGLSHGLAPHPPGPPSGTAALTHCLLWLRIAVRSGQPETSPKGPCSLGREALLTHWLSPKQWMFVIGTAFQRTPCWKWGWAAGTTTAPT